MVTWLTLVTEGAVKDLRQVKVVVTGLGEVTTTWGYD